MDFICPRCGVKTTEMVECSNCETVGCVRCITKRSGQWLCGDCRDGRKVMKEKTEERNEYKGYVILSEEKEEQTPESALAAMFG